MNPLLCSPLIVQCMSRARKEFMNNLLVICARHVDDVTKVDVTGAHIKENPHRLLVIAHWDLQGDSQLLKQSGSF